MSISSDEVNFLVYRYLQESGKSYRVNTALHAVVFAANCTPVKKKKKDFKCNIVHCCSWLSVIELWLHPTFQIIRASSRLLPLSIHLWHREPHQPVQHQWSPGAPCCPHLHHPEGPAVCGGWSQHQWGQAPPLKRQLLISISARYIGKKRCTVSFLFLLKFVCCFVHCCFRG